jgi:polar amino acid transport system substrate-binding protein
VTAPRRPARWAIAVAAATVAVLCWPAGSVPLAHAVSARTAIGARLTAQAQPAAHAATHACDPTASLRPAGPPTVTPGSYMAKIRKRGDLIAGVDLGTYHFGYLNPFDGHIEGFDIDMLRAISAAIFGDPNKIRFVAVSDDQRIPAIESGKVDIVAHTMTITCARLKDVDFSTVYFDAAERVLVLRNSAAKSLADLTGQKVCATPSSTSLAYLTAGHLVDPVVAADWTDCLVLLQQGDVAAISTDDSILAGLAAQDPYTKIIGPRLSNEPYGLAISQQHPDFVRFVNAVLARMRADGQWAASYRRWVGTPVPAPPPARYQG